MLLSLLLAGCRMEVHQVVQDSAVVSDDPTASWTQSDALTPCQVYGGAFGAGATWVYDFFQKEGEESESDDRRGEAGVNEDEEGESLQGTTTIQLLQSDPTTGALEQHEEFRYEQWGITYILATTRSMGCTEDGLYLRSAAQTAHDDQGTSAAVSTVHYDSPVLLLPSWLKLGDTWTQELSGTVHDQLGDHRFSSQLRCRIVDTVEVDVPLGTYIALQEECLDESSTVTTRYLAPDVGMVLSDTLSLVDFHR